jgi:sRNA-binding regulator protein Hfq
MKIKTSSFCKSIVPFATVLLFVLTGTLPAAQIKLNNGTVLVGEIVSQDQSFIVVQIGETRNSIPKNIVTEIVAAPAITVAETGTAPAAAPAQQQPQTQPAAVQTSAVNVQQPAAGQSIDISGAAPGKAIEITLNNGSKFKGIVAAADDRLIALEVAPGSKVDFYKNIIVDVHELPSSSSAISPAPVPAVQAPAVPEKTVEITLNNGSKFVGTVAAADERVITLEVAGGAKVNLYRTMILNVSDSSLLSFAPMPAPAQFAQAPTAPRSWPALSSEQTYFAPTLDTSKVKYISVLPLESKDINSSLLSVLTDEFRRSLNETDSFKVMERDMMEKILREQAFQMTGAVDEAYMVKVGRIVGVSRIVSGSIVKMGEGAYAASVKMVAVESGSILATASEKRTGDSFEVNKRMLRNLAFALAGKTTPDRAEYLKMAARETEEGQLAEKIGQSRFFIYVNGLSAFPVHLLQSNDEMPRRIFYEKDTGFTAWGVPKDAFDFGTSGTFGFRLTQKWWLVGKGGYDKSGWRKGYSFRQCYFDTTFYTGTHPDTTLLEGPGDYISRSQRSWSMIDVGCGLRFYFFRNPRIALGVTVMPEIGFISCTEEAYDSSFSNANFYENGVFAGKNLIYDQTIRTTKLSGTAFGGDVSGTAEVHLFKNIGINLTCGFNLMMAGTLQGKTTSRLYEITRNAFQNITVDSSYSENAALVKGNYLGTGEYFQIVNPDVKHYDPNGSLVSISKASKEFTSFRITLGLMYFF